MFNRRFLTFRTPGITRAAGTPLALVGGLALLSMLACGGDNTSFNLSAPTIETQPTSQTIRTTQTATFTVTAKAVPDPRYQWQKDGVDILGANNVSLVIAGASLADAGSYQVVVKNSEGSVTSAVATLTVQPSLLFATPTGVGSDAAGNLYVANSADHTICKVTPAGVVSVLAGASGQAGSADGPGPSARFSWPTSVAVTPAGVVYVGDAHNTIRMISTGGVVSTLAGSAGQSGATDSATGSLARFGDLIQGLALDGSGNLIVADTYNHTLRQVTPAGVVTTLIGTAGLPGSADGAAGTGLLSNPGGVAVGTTGTIYVADYGNHTIRTFNGTSLATLAGTAGSAGSTDGTGSAARFGGPIGLAVDAAGKVYVLDALGQTLRRVDPGALVSTLAGTTLFAGNVDGQGTAARFNHPTGICFDPAGNLVVADSTNGTLRKVTTSGFVSTYIAP